MGGIWCLSLVFQILDNLQLLHDFVPSLYLSESQIPMPGMFVSQLCKMLAPFHFLSLRLKIFFSDQPSLETWLKNFPCCSPLQPWLASFLTRYLYYAFTLFPALQHVSPLYHMQGPWPPWPQVYPCQARAHPQRSSNNIAHLEWKHMKWDEYSTCHTWSLRGLRASGTWKQLIKSTCSAHALCVLGLVWPYRWRVEVKQVDIHDSKTWVLQSPLYRYRQTTETQKGRMICLPAEYIDLLCF